jgi:hypothetical protein
MTIFALCCFACGLDPDPDAAAEALGAAGYEVIRRPLALKIEPELEGDDFLEIRGEGNDDEDSRDAMEAEVNRIIKPFGGEIDPTGALTMAELWEPKSGKKPKSGNVISLAEKRGKVVSLAEESDDIPF